MTAPSPMNASSSEHVLNLPAPAKLNLFLHVTGRRDDGLHLLETVFQFIDLQDDIRLELDESGVISRTHDPEGVSESDDLTLRAARSLKAATGTPLGARISLSKRIPIGAGLGGGSSDAATVLLGLNRLWNTGLSREQLIDLARPLGADVPIFVYGQNAYATGIGDIFQPIELPERWFVLLMPHVHVATAGVFSAPELTRDTKPITIQSFTALAGRNDLQPVVEARQPAVRHAVEALSTAAQRLSKTSAGAEKSGNITVRMTGSGACVFAATGCRATATALIEEIRRNDEKHAVIRQSDAERITIRTASGTLYLVKGLATHPLGSRQVG
ncbi:MAG: 4-(cytidine 5'-diphospho)-2-C-methyl-D-erythritol kinase [Lautropia sp.]|nr:4-(cytidine 5'-diphospho)-2-C-methyl-D-erythritol kinase [Lautropia sp.]